MKYLTLEAYCKFLHYFLFEMPANKFTYKVVDKMNFLL